MSSILSLDGLTQDVSHTASSKTEAQSLLLRIRALGPSLESICVRKTSAAGFFPRVGNRSSAFEPSDPGADHLVELPGSL